MTESESHPKSKPPAKPVVLTCSVGQRVVQERDDLRAGTDLIGAEGVLSGPGGDALAHRPGHRLGVVRPGGYVGEGDRPGFGPVRQLPQIGHGGGPGGGGVAVEQGPGDQALVLGPCGGVGIPGARGDIREGASAGGSGGAVGPPQEGDDLGGNALDLLVDDKIQFITFECI